MTLSRLFVVGALALLTGAASLWQLRPASSSPQVPTISADATGPLDTPAGWRYRQAQPTHWRACLLEH